MERGVIAEEFEIGQHHPSVEKGWIGVIAADAQILDPEGGEPLVQAFGGRRPPIGKSLSAVAHMNHRRIADAAFIENRKDALLVTVVVAEDVGGLHSGFRRDFVGKLPVGSSNLKAWVGMISPKESGANLCFTLWKIGVEAFPVSVASSTLLA